MWERVRAALADVNWGTAPNWTIAVFAGLATWAGFRTLRYHRRLLAQQRAQLNEQRTQLAEQRMFFEHQSAVLELQRAELHAAARDRKRIQARLVEVTSRTEEPSEEWPEGLEGRRRAASVTNASHEPIHHVVLRFGNGDESGQAAQVVQAYGSSRTSEPPLVLLRPRRGATFFSTALADGEPVPGSAIVRFTDHNGVHWQLDEDGQLEELDERQAW
jgi:hypothetical protein